MNFHAILLSVNQLWGMAAEPEACRFKLAEIELPVSTIGIEVMDGSGALLTPKAERKLEFSHVIVRAPISSDSFEVRYWKPASMADAAVGLKIMLPADFYARLLHGYGGEKWSAPGDPAVSERWDDLVGYLEQTWGTEWSGDKGAYEQLRELINYSISSDVPVPESCVALKEE